MERESARASLYLYANTDVAPPMLTQPHPLSTFVPIICAHVYLWPTLPPYPARPGGLGPDVVRFEPPVEGAVPAAAHLRVPPGYAPVTSTPMSIPDITVARWQHRMWPALLPCCLVALFAMHCMRGHRFLGDAYTMTFLPYHGMVFERCPRIIR